MLAVNDPQNFYYAYDPEERRMQIVQEQASEKPKPEEQPSPAKHGSLMDDYLAMIEQPTPDDGDTPNSGDFDDQGQIKEQKAGWDEQMIIAYS